MVSKYKAQLSHLNSELDVGETIRSIQCPFCLRQDGDFAVTRTEDGLLYKCFRVACDSRGFIPSNLGHWSTSYSVTGVISKRCAGYPFESDIIRLSDKQINFLETTFHLTKKQLKYNKIRWCNHTERIIYPILSREGDIKGYVARYYKELSDKKYDGVKSRTYWINRTDNYYNVSFPSINYSCLDVDNDELFVLVEDIPSSIRVSRYVQSIALLSNSIPTKAMGLLSRKNVVIVLDNDAIAHALKIKQRYSLFFKSCQVIPIDKDPKNMSNEELLQNIIDKIQIKLNVVNN